MALIYSIFIYIYLYKDLNYTIIMIPPGTRGAII